MKIALAQINPTVGDIAGNLRKIRAWMRRAERQKADLVAFPELCITGYPPRDLVEQRCFIDQNKIAVEELARETRRMGVLVGYIEKNHTKGEKGLFNSAALLARGAVQAIRHKTLLPTYDVFDEARHFAIAHGNDPVRFEGQRIGLHICEDMWHVPQVWPETPYHTDPIVHLGNKGVNFFINLSSSPFHRGKTRLRLDLVRHHVNRFKKPFLFVNQVGGNDEILFDGHSFALAPNGEAIAQAKGFEEDLLWVDTRRFKTISWRETLEIEQVGEALIMGLRDYTRKCGFQKVLLGLSGGIDSSVTAALAVRALGPQNVLGVLMPSPFSSQGSVTDSLTLAKNLRMKHTVLPISPVFSAYTRSLATAFAKRKPDVAEENLQARIRGTLLMALSNKFDMLLLTTGNKSELSMGYCTLYGDMNGGLAVISDVPKTMVYKLGRWLNAEKAVIPEASFTKPPSAELRPNQTDQDSLPPYEVLDAIVEAYVEEGKDVEEIEEMGYPKALVRKVLTTIDRSEYKRRQAAPGLRISVKAFGIGRRMPIARGDFRS